MKGTPGQALKWSKAVRKWNVDFRSERPSFPVTPSQTGYSNPTPRNSQFDSPDLALFLTSSLLLTLVPSRDACFPQLYGVSQPKKCKSQFIIIHNGMQSQLSLTPFVVGNLGITNLHASITTFPQQGQLLEVAAIATRFFQS